MWFKTGGHVAHRGCRCIPSDLNTFREIFVLSALGTEAQGGAVVHQQHTVSLGAES